MGNKIRKEQTDGLLNQVYTDSSLTGLGTEVSPLSVVGGGGGGGAVDSVNGQTGTVLLDTDSIAEGIGNFYFTNERAQDAIGAALLDTSTILWTYNDTNGTISANIQAFSITSSMLQNVIVSKGGTSRSDLTSGAILYGNGTAAVGLLGPGTANQIVGMNAAATFPEFKTLTVGTAGTAIGFANTAGVMTLNVPDASNSARGAVNTGAQTFGGLKTFSSIPLIPTSTPTLATQVASKGYVDAIAASINPSLYKNACTVATTANITLSGEQTIDTFATSATRVLVWQQTIPSQNGIYISNAGAWTRASDYDTAGEIQQGTSTFILDGSVNKNRLFVMNAASVTVINTDPITWTPISSLTSYNFFTGTTGSDFNVDVSGNNITFHLPAASATSDGKLLATDWDIFNAKASLSLPVSPVVGSIAIYNDTNELTVVDTVQYQDDYGGFGAYLLLGGVTNPMVLLLNGIFTIAPDEANTYGLGTNTPIFGGVDQAMIFTSEEGPSMWIGGGGKGVRIITYDGTSFNGLGGTYTLPNMQGTVGQVPVFAGDGEIMTWASVGLSADVQVFTSSGTWTKPTGAKTVLVTCVGGGGGGGSGRKGALATVRGGGGGGGAGGWATHTFVASAMAGTVAVTVGAGGTGAAAITANTTSGGLGSSGGASTFGTLLRAMPGGGGGGGTTSGAGGGGTGGIFPGGVSSSVTNGASGGTGTVGNTPGWNVFSPGSGGGGGSVNASNTGFAGGAGGPIGTSTNLGNSGYGTVLAGGTAGAISGNGGAGNAAPTNSGVGGSGGGGGGGSNTTNAGSGGTGGFPGGGGGGGGGGTNSVGNSGAGGTGGAGLVIVITYF